MGVSKHGFVVAPPPPTPPRKGEGRENRDSDFQNKRLTPAANHRLIAPILSRKRGRSAIVTDVGAGCGGRGASSRAYARGRATLTRTAKVVWS